MNLDAANAKLDRAKLRQKGDRLYIRATLPPKSGDGKWKQQEIKTGCVATPQGIKAALAKAQKLESDLMLERFTWADWGIVDPATEKERWNFEQAIARFEKEYWEIKPKTPARAEYFKNNYGRPFAVLPLDEQPTLETLRKLLVTATEPDTRTREYWHQAYTALARFCGIEPPPGWTKLRGNYEPRKRAIPTDDEIIATWERLAGHWRWAYGMLAVYGLRNHEIVRLEFDWPRVYVNDDTKTGHRVVYPLHPDWPQRFELEQINAPRLNSLINSNNGRTVGQAFRRRKINHTPYALRDAYAVRAAKLGISPAIAAKWMGHSLNTHYEHYLKYLDQIDFDSVWKGLGKK